jgi:hypothetical protein
VRRCLSCLYLPQLAAPRPGTRVVRLGTCFHQLIIIYLFVYASGVCVHTHMYVIPVGAS